MERAALFAGELPCDGSPLPARETVLGGFGGPYPGVSGECGFVVSALHSDCRTPPPPAYDTSCASCLAEDRPQVTAHLCVMVTRQRSPASAESFPASEPQPVAPLPTQLDPRSRGWVLLCRNSNWCFALRVFKTQSPRSWQQINHSVKEAVSG